MTALYDGREADQAAVQARRVWMILGALTALYAAAVALCFVFRRPLGDGAAKTLVMGTTVLWGSLCLFLWGLRLSPVWAYSRYMDEVARGLTREAQGVVRSFAEDGTYKEGVFFYALVICVENKDNREEERVYYVDRCKPRPPLAPVGDGALVGLELALSLRGGRVRGLAFGGGVRQ
ncbi:MAG: hypothetical protein LBU67_07415, partial [Oscillospiraceae bacterium]|nr:hypothetical protein [Oscillospiraceae bacterium]